MGDPWGSVGSGDTEDWSGKISTVEGDVFLCISDIPDMIVFI